MIIDGSFLKVNPVCYDVVELLVSFEKTNQFYIQELQIEGRMSIVKPVVYTVSNCPACLRLKRDWSGQGTEFEERQVDENQTYLDEALRYGDMVPIIVYGDGRVEVGYANMIG